MFLFALKSTLAKKLRLFSTALSVTLGVAFLAGTLVFTDTIQRTFDDLFADVFQHTDSYVRSTNVVDMEFGGSQRGRMPESIVDRVAAVDGVADAQPLVQGFAQLVASDGDPIGKPGEGAPTFGMNWIDGALGSWTLTEGSRPPGPGEVVVDQKSADDGGFALGDTVTVLTQTGPHELVLVGTARFGSADSPGGASVSNFDLATAQELLLGGVGMVDAVMVDAVAGVSEDDLTARITAVVPAGVEALTGTAITDEAQDDMKEAMSFFDTFLMVFAVIGLVVACFTIYNTFQIIVTQRSKEMALLRAVGASSRQVLGAQLLEAVFVGLVASVVGLAAGVLVAGGLKAMLAGFGIAIPAGGTVFQTRTAVVALVVGTTVTVVSAIFPSLRASRVPPLAAMRDVVIERRSASDHRRLVYGGALTAAGVVALVLGLGGEVLWVGLGALAIFVGVFVLGPLLARPSVRAVGAPLPVLSGITGELARENAMRSPKRTARTGGALMVGVALVSAITVIAASAKDWIRDVWGEEFTGDYVVSTQTFGYGGLSTDLAARLNELPEVDVATGVRVGVAQVRQPGQPGRSDIEYVSVDPATAGRLFDIGMLSGSIAALSPDGVMLDDGEAEGRGLAVGDTLTFGFLNGTSTMLRVEGIYTDEELAGSFLVSHALHERTGADQFDFSVYLKAAPGFPADAVKAALAAVTDDYANAELESRREYVESQAAQLDQLVNLMYGLLGLAVIIALFSIANTMALSIHERTRELGLLRAVGMTRRQARVAVRWEAILIALFGTGLGVAIGVFFGWSISVALRDEGFGTFTLPVPALLVIVALAVVGGVLAAARPARRAARLDVLRAISTE
jgi:putative ABC transport system permease protein